MEKWENLFPRSFSLDLKGSFYIEARKDSIILYLYTIMIYHFLMEHSSVQKLPSFVLINRNLNLFWPLFLHYFFAGYFAAYLILFKSNFLLKNTSYWVCQLLNILYLLHLLNIYIYFHFFKLSLLSIFYTIHYYMLINFFSYV